jgi:putative ABC transport system permease protein
MLRRLAKSPGYTVSVVATLALAIGATSAMFSAVHAVLLNPLPIRDPGQLVILWGNDPQRNYGVVEYSYNQFEELRTSSRSFSDIALVGSTTWSAVLEERGEPVKIQSAGVSSAFFGTFGAHPRLGRLLRPEDDAPNAAKVVVISHGLWVSRLGSDPGVVGRVLRLDGESFEVVGVMPPDFDYPRGADYWTPVMPILAAASTAWGTDAREVGIFFIIGRLAPGVSAAMASDDLNAIAARMQSRGAKSSFPPRVTLTPFLDNLIGPARQAIWALFAAVAVLLLTACANVSGLMLTRVSLRQREQAIRLALGAGRSAIARLWIRETLVLAIAGGGLGLLLAQWLTGAIVAMAPEGIPRLDQVAVNLPVAGFTFGAVLLAALLCGAAPVGHAGVANVVEGLAEGGRSTAGRRVHRARSALLVLQIGFAIVLLVSAGLITRSFAALGRVDVGFESSPKVLMLSAEPRIDKPSPNEWTGQMLDRVQAIPGVTEAGAVYLRPLALGAIGQGTLVTLEGQPQTPEAAAGNPVLNYQVATPGYFRAMGISLERGRLFTAQDTAATDRVAIVGESTAARLWPGQDPVGRRFNTSTFSRGKEPRTAWRTVVGVVSDVRYRGIDQVHLDVYDPALQTPIPATDLAIRTTGDPLALAAAVQAEARRLDPGVLIGSIATLDTIVDRAIAPWRFSAWVFTLFALLAFALSTMGLFSTVNLDAAERRREFAIRVAMGADRRAITGAVLRAASVRVAAGIALGVVAAAVGTRALRSLLYGVEPIDAMTYAVVLVLVAVVVAVASRLPARAAARVEPVELLRE